MYGYELDKLARQYGLGSPTAPTYTGATKPTDTTAANYQDQLNTYNADQAAFNAYQNEYQNRLRNTQMYAQPQFQSPATHSQAYQTQLGNNTYPQFGTPQYEAYTGGINN